MYLLPTPGWSHLAADLSFSNCWLTHFSLSSNHTLYQGWTPPNLPSPRMCHLPPDDLAPELLFAKCWLTLFSLCFNITTYQRWTPPKLLSPLIYHLPPDDRILHPISHFPTADWIIFHFLLTTLPTRDKLRRTSLAHWCTIYPRMITSLPIKGPHFPSAALRFTLPLLVSVHPLKPPSNVLSDLMNHTPRWSSIYLEKIFCP